MLHNYPFKILVLNNNEQSAKNTTVKVMGGVPDEPGALHPSLYVACDNGHAFNLYPKGKNS